LLIREEIEVRKFIRNCMLGTFVALSSIGGFTTITAAQELSIITLEWPPYTASEMPKGGATSSVATAIFKAAGLDVGLKFAPWKRAISVAKNDPSVIAYFPGYHCRHSDGFIASDPIGNGPIGFAENINSPIVWENLDDVGEQKLKIGTVLGYANSDEFDRKAGTGWIRAIPANDDITNLRKLMRQRIDAAVIDKLVMSYLLATKPTLKGGETEIQFNAKPLEDKILHMCFSDDPKGQALRDRFNAAISSVDIEKMVNSYFKDEL
jgi:polar amino acid transport system substrate-binding protein